MLAICGAGDLYLVLFPSFGSRHASLENFGMRRLREALIDSRFGDAWRMYISSTSTMTRAWMANSPKSQGVAWSGRGGFANSEPYER